MNCTTRIKCDASTTEPHDKVDRETGLDISCGPGSSVIIAMMKFLTSIEEWFIKSRGWARFA